MGTATAPNGFGRPAWDAIRNARQVHGWGLVPVSTTLVNAGHSTTFNRPLFVAPPVVNGRFKVEAGSITFGGSGTVIDSDGTDYWTFDLQVGNEADGWASLATSPLNSSGDFTANTAYPLVVDGPETAAPKNVYLAAGDMVRLLYTKVGPGSVTNLTSITMNIVLFLRHSPPTR